MGFGCNSKRKKLLLLLLLRRQWMQSRRDRQEEVATKNRPSTSTDIPGPSTSYWPQRVTSLLPTSQEEELEYSLLRLRREKLLLELEKLTEERERIAAERRNVRLRREILEMRGVFKCARCLAPSKQPTTTGLRCVEGVPLLSQELSSNKKRHFNQDTEDSDKLQDVKIIKLSLSEDSVSCDGSYT